MTAVPPPVPPEIVEKATHALKAALWGPYGVRPSDSSVAAVVIAAVYGDIVEAARRDALTEAVEQAARMAERIPSPFADNVVGAVRALLRDATASRTAPAATQADQQPESAPAPVHDAEGPQIATEGHDDDRRIAMRCWEEAHPQTIAMWRDRAERAEAKVADLEAAAEHWERVMVVVTDQAAEYVTTFARVRALCRESEIATASAPGDGAYRARVLVADIRAALDGTEDPSDD